jgi:hypothetical protein
MLNWLVGHEVEAVIAIIALVALAVSIHAQRRMSQLGSMSFPAVIAEWIAVHKAGDRGKAIPPLERDLAEFRLQLTERVAEFSMAEIRLTRWDDYWSRYRLHIRVTGDNAIIGYVARLQDPAHPLPTTLRVKVERRGGVQAACWQRVRIEGTPVSE